MYGPKISMLRCLSALSSGVPVNPIRVAPGRIALHGPVQLAGLGPVALVHEDEDLARRPLATRDVAPQFAHVLVDVAFLGASELVNERADQRLGGVAKRLRQIGSALRAVDVLVHTLEDHLDLLVKLGAVGDDEDPAVHVPEFTDPLRQPHHREALPAALGVPDDPAFATADVLPGLLHAEVLVVPADLLDAGVEDHEVVDEFEQAVGRAEVAEFGEEGGSGGVVVGGAGFLPAEPVLLPGLDHAVAQPLGVVARHDELYGAEERLDELLLLAVQVLADPLRHGDGGPLEFQDADGDPVDVEHDVGPLGVLASDRDFLGDGEVVGGGVRPVDQVDGDGVFAEPGPDVDAVAKETVDLAVRVVEGLAPAERGGFVELVECFGDEGGGVALALQEPGEELGLDVPVVVAFVPVAEEGVAEVVSEMADDPALGLPLELADLVHVTSEPPSDRPVTSRPGGWHRQTSAS